VYILETLCVYIGDIVCIYWRHCVYILETLCVYIGDTVCIYWRHCVYILETLCVYIGDIVCIYWRHCVYITCCVLHICLVINLISFPTRTIRSSPGCPNGAIACLFGAGPQPNIKVVQLLAISHPVGLEIKL
jgi:hypothetical protein